MNLDSAPGLTIRRATEHEDFARLTEILHLAYAFNAERGFHFLATHQDESVTRERLLSGIGFVGFVGDELVGTVCVYHPASRDGTYQPPHSFASFGQFGVDPAYKGRGFGHALYTEAENWCRSQGIEELLLDTADEAHHLISMYEAWGFEIRGAVDYRPVVNYTSVVMGKMLV
jgi:GNAT superfamily N-acetyltransferase